MADRPPPSRYSVVERGGRLVVIDRDTGASPPSAAERMAEYDRRMGHERAAPAARVDRPEEPAAQAIVPIDPIRAAITENPAAAARLAKAVGEMNRKQPWKDAGQKPSSKPSSKPAPARVAQRPPLQARGRKTIVTGKWWDAKGPRTIELGPKGQQTLSGGFVTLVVVAFVAAVIALFVQPILFFIGGFLLFRFGGQVLGPIGAGIVDKAIAEKG